MTFQEIINKLTKVAQSHYINHIAIGYPHRGDLVFERTGVCAYGDFWYIKLKIFNIRFKNEVEVEVKINRHTYKVPAGFMPFENPNPILEPGTKLHAR